MLGSLSEADDAIQESWIRLRRSDPSDVENLGGWLTTVVARVSLDMLRSRKSRREEPWGAHLPDPIVSRADGGDPEHEALLADSVGSALLVVLEALAPAERLAFERGPRCGGRGWLLLGAGTGRTTGTRQRSRRSRVGSGRTAACSTQLHDHAREDRRNRHPRRPRAPPPARPDHPQRLTNQLAGAIKS